MTSAHGNERVWDTGTVPDSNVVDGTECHGAATTRAAIHGPLGAGASPTADTTHLHPAGAELSPASAGLGVAPSRRVLFHDDWRARELAAARSQLGGVA